MPTQLQFRRGTTVQSAAYTGAVGEVTVDQGLGTLRVHDGSTAGGNVLVSTTATQTLTNKTLGAFSVSGNVVPTANVSYNIGSSSSWFNTFYGVASHAQYADLAENYLADAPYTPGTVVMFGGTSEITLASAGTKAVAGVVSANPAYLMNGALSGSNVTPVAFTGRVMVNCQGPVAKGDLMVSYGNGYAVTNNNPSVGQVIGKAVGSTTVHGFAEVEVVIGRF